MASWARKRGSKKNGRLYYVDGFAGRGKYGNQEPFEEGSPVRVARLADLIRRENRENREYRLYCLNSEIDPVRCDRLKQALAFASPEVVTTYCGAFENHLAEMMKASGSNPAVFFLDPFGIIGIAPNDLKPVVQRYDTEILLTLSLPTIYRMSGSSNSDAPEALGKVSRLSEVLGEDPSDPNPEWARKKIELDTDAWADWVVQRYLKQIQTLSPQLRYGLSYPIREKLHSGIKYFLIFATRSMDAFPLMTDFICTEEDDLELEHEIESRKQGQLSLFEPRPTVKREEKFPGVIEEIHQYGLAHQGCTRKELIEQFALRYLGHFKQKHFRYMVDELIRSNRASIEERGATGIERDRRPITFR